MVTKKILIFLLIFMALVPAISLACDCCPAQPHPDFSKSFIGQGEHPCCSKMIPNVKKCASVVREELVSIFPQVSSHPVGLNHFHRSVQSQELFELHPDEIFPPFITFDTPLYLAHPILRI